MQLLITFWFITMVKLVKGLEFISKDQDATDAYTAGHDSIHNKRFPDYLTNRPASMHRMLDSFRFYHRGLGKRTENEIVDKSVLDNTMEILKKLNFDKYSTITNIMKASRFYNDILKRQDMNTIIGTKHVLLSQNDYPNQANRQLEVQNDDTSNRMAWSDTLKNGQSPSPATMSFENVDSIYDDIGGTDKLDRSLEAFPSVQKRVWAMARLKQLRMPRHQVIRSRIYSNHVDPALYFIGLGK